MPLLQEGMATYEPDAPSRSQPFRFWLACGVTLLCILGGILISNVKILGGEDSQPLRDGAVLATPARKEPDPRELALRFLKASSASEKARLTRFPEKDLEHIRGHYADADSLDEKVAAFREIGVVHDDDGTSFWAFAAVLEGGRAHLLAVVEDPSGALAVDWSCYVCANDPRLDELGIPENAGKDYPFRVLAERSDYYNNRFADESGWACYVLSVPGRDDHVHGYCRRGSVAQLALEAALPDTRKPQRVMLRLRGDPGGMRTNQFEITGFLRKEWVVP